MNMYRVVAVDAFGSTSIREYSRAAHALPYYDILEEDEDILYCALFYFEHDRAVWKKYSQNMKGI